MSWVLAKRGLFGLLTALAGTFLVFLICQSNGESAVVSALGEFASPEQRRIWLTANGYDLPLLVRYLQWLGGLLSLDLGWSRSFNAPVADVISGRIGNTALLLLGFFLFTIPLSFTAGVIAGINKDGIIDKVILIVAIVLTSTPPYAMAVLVSLIFVFQLQWLPGTSSMMDGFSFQELILPVLVLVLFDGGYIARIVRVATAQVMEQPYVRTARLKALPTRRILLRHVLRNALIAPVTILLIHVNWVLTGVVVVEYFFAFKEFGSLILEASLSRDINLLAGCTVVSILVAIVTQILADVAYAVLDPRIRLA